jgi:hypothetical protein
VTHLSRGQYHIECQAYESATVAQLASLCPAGLFGVAESHTYGGVADLELSLAVRAEPAARAEALAEC